MKPLGHKSYGSIPHFKGSRMGPADKHCEPGQQKIMTEKLRDRHDLIIVQEKLDGSNCAVAKIDGKINKNLTKTVCPDYDNDCKDMSIDHASWCFHGCQNHKCNPGVSLGTAKGICPIIHVKN